MKMDFINCMKHSPVKNYGGIPGLTSYLIGEPSEKGLVRLLECSRNHEEDIIPHSHRFDFQCFVLSGEVKNVTWKEWYPTQGYSDFDEFQETKLEYCGSMGNYTKKVVRRHWYRADSAFYKTGSQYGMTANEIHSIFFTKGTSVLFLEGPDVTNDSIILEPYVDGEVVPTFKVEPWMFKKG